MAHAGDPLHSVYPYVYLNGPTTSSIKTYTWNGKKWVKKLAIKTKSTEEKERR